MFQIVYKYLILNRQVTIPGIGIFQIVQLPARLDFANKVICSPIPTIKFTAATTDSDQNFYAFAADQLHINTGSAVDEVDDFALLLKATVARQKMVELPNMGTLQIDAAGTVSFMAKAVLQEYYPDIAADRVLRNDGELPLATGDKVPANTQMQDIPNDRTAAGKNTWWIAAIVLAIIGIAAILYYYLVIEKL